MALNLNLVDEEEMRNLGFKTALFIDVPKWTKEKNTNKLNNEVISAGNTPDQNKLNKSLISNLISQDLLRKLEEESPSRGDNIDFDNYFENKHFFSRKLSFDEENEEDFDSEDSETKVSKLSKISKNSDSSSEKTKERKSNSFQMMPNSKDNRVDFNKKYPSSMDSHQQCFQSNEDKDFTFYNQEKNNSNSKIRFFI